MHPDHSRRFHTIRVGQVLSIDSMLPSVWSVYVSLPALHVMLQCLAHHYSHNQCRCLDASQAVTLLANHVSRAVLTVWVTCRRYGPPGAKRLVYFVDDMNMPFVDKYDTQSAIELIRQSVDYRGWFDKVKIVLKEVTNAQYCACMNPTAGSFNITPRMQRHFATFAVQMPNADIVRTVYLAMVEGHLSHAGFEGTLLKLAPKLIDASIELHRHVMNNFLPSAVKFHYQFNLRELSNITQGLCRMTKDYYK